MISDQWGRLENASGLTASNVAKYDGLHSMVVFKEHPPSLMNKVSGSLFTYLSSSSIELIFFLFFFLNMKRKKAKKQITFNL